MIAFLKHLKEWTGITATDMDMLYYILIGIVCGLILKGKGASIILSIIVGSIGALCGGLFLNWTNLFPYSQFVGAAVGSLLFLGVKRVFRSDL